MKPNRTPFFEQIVVGINSIVTSGVRKLVDRKRALIIVRGIWKFAIDEMYDCNFVDMT